MKKILLAMALSTSVSVMAAAMARAGGAQLPKLPGLGSLKVPPTQNDYRGSIEFLWEVKGPAGSMKEKWTATVNATGVQCIGTSDVTSQGQLDHTDLRGPGLFHLAFDSGRGEYAFELACPVA